mgnify:FL=1
MQDSKITAALDAVTDLVARFDRLPLGDRDGHRRTGVAWATKPDLVAKIVVIIRTSSVNDTWWRNALMSRNIPSQAIRYFLRGCSSTGAPWLELRSLLKIAKVRWNGQDFEEAVPPVVVPERAIVPSTVLPPATFVITAPANPADAIRVPAAPDSQWRIMEGTSGDIEVTTRRVLAYGTPEHSAFLRRVLPECGTVRS